MKYKLTGDLHLAGAFIVPAGTIIDGNDPQWNSIPIPLPMPPMAQALDQDAYDALAVAHQESLHLLQYVRGVTPITPAELPMFLTRMAEKETNE